MISVSLFNISSDKLNAASNYSTGNKVYIGNDSYTVTILINAVLSLLVIKVKSEVVGKVNLFETALLPNSPY